MASSASASTCGNQGKRARAWWTAGRQQPWAGEQAGLAARGRAAAERRRAVSRLRHVDCVGPVGCGAGHHLVPDLGPDGGRQGGEWWVAGQLARVGGHGAPAGGGLACERSCTRLKAGELRGSQGGGPEPHRAEEVVGALRAVLVPPEARQLRRLRARGCGRRPSGARRRRAAMAGVGRRRASSRPSHEASQGTRRGCRGRRSPHLLSGQPWAQDRAAARISGGGDGSGAAGRRRSQQQQDPEPCRCGLHGYLAVQVARMLECRGHRAGGEREGAGNPSDLRANTCSVELGRASRVETSAGRRDFARDSSVQVGGAVAAGAARAPSGTGYLQLRGLDQAHAAFYSSMHGRMPMARALGPWRSAQGASMARRCGAAAQQRRCRPRRFAGRRLHLQHGFSPSHTLHISPLTTAPVAFCKRPLAARLRNAPSSTQQHPRSARTLLGCRRCCDALRRAGGRQSVGVDRRCRPCAAASAALAPPPACRLDRAPNSVRPTLLSEAPRPHREKNGRPMKLTPAFCALALLAALPPPARACSDMLLADESVSPAVVGFRNLDFPPMAEASSGPAGGAMRCMGFRRGMGWAGVGGLAARRPRRRRALPRPALPTTPVPHPQRDLPFTFTQAVVPAGTEMQYLPPGGCEPSGFDGQPSKIGCAALRLRCTPATAPRRAGAVAALGCKPPGRQPSPPAGASAYNHNRPPPAPAPREQLHLHHLLARVPDCRYHKRLRPAVQRLRRPVP